MTVPSHRYAKRSMITPYLEPVAADLDVISPQAESESSCKIAVFPTDIIYIYILYIPLNKVYAWWRLQPVPTFLNISEKCRDRPI